MVNSLKSTVEARLKIEENWELKEALFGRNMQVMSTVVLFIIYKRNEIL